MRVVALGLADRYDPRGVFMQTSGLTVRTLGALAGFVEAAFGVAVGNAAAPVELPRPTKLMFDRTNHPLPKPTAIRSEPVITAIRCCLTLKNPIQAGQFLYCSFLTS